MSFIIHSNHNVVKQNTLFKTGKEKSKNQVIRYWGENGLIHMSWSEPNKKGVETERYQTISIREALIRVKALSDILGRTPRSDKFLYSDEIKSLQDFIEDMLALIRRTSQTGKGDPLDPKNKLGILSKMERRPVTPPKVVYVRDFHG